MNEKYLPPEIGDKVIITICYANDVQPKISKVEKIFKRYFQLVDGSKIRIDNWRPYGGSNIYSYYPYNDKKCREDYEDSLDRIKYNGLCSSFLESITKNYKRARPKNREVILKKLSEIQQLISDS